MSGACFLGWFDNSPSPRPLSHEGRGAEVEGAVEKSAYSITTSIADIETSKIL